MGMGTRIRERKGDTDWMEHAACRGLDPEFFYPKKGESTTEAREVCLSCPVRVQCELAGREEFYGMWGGLSELDRRRQRHLWRRSA